MSDHMCGLRRAAAMGLLGQSLFYCHADLYHLDVPHWSALSVLEQHKWVQRAQDVMDNLKPAAVTCPPVGAVSPPAVTAGAVTRPVSPLFEQAAAMARADGRRVLAFREKGTHDASG